jgi:hypothetical protein
MTAPTPPRPRPVERFYLVAIVVYVLLATAFGVRYLAGDQPAANTPPLRGGSR